MAGMKAFLGSIRLMKTNIDIGPSVISLKTISLLIRLRLLATILLPIIVAVVIIIVMIKRKAIKHKGSCYVIQELHCRLRWQ